MRRRACDFEHRFLSEQYRGGVGALELAMLYQGQVFSCELFRKPEALTIGASAQARFMVESSKLGALRTLARPAGARWELLLDPEGDGFALIGERKLRFAELEAAGAARREGELLVLLVDGSVRVKLVFGQLALLLHFVSVPSLRVPFLALSASSLMMLLGVVLSGMLHAGFGMLAVVTTSRVDELLIDRLDVGSRYADALLTPESQPEPVEEKLQLAEEELAENQNQAGVEEGVERAGEQSHSPQEQGSTGPRNDQNVASNAGLLNARHEMNSLLATGMNQGGLEAMNEWGQFTMDSAGLAGPGNGYGLSMVGAGRPSGGSGGDFVLGRFGQRGPQKGSCEDCDGAANLGKLVQKGPELKLRKPDIEGTLDKRIIQKVVHQHRNELKACYERQLQKKRELAGTVTMQWLIDVSGNVAMVMVRESTLDDEAVELCITNSVQHWRFPAAKSAMVKVVYPFTFSQGE